MINKLILENPLNELFLGVNSPRIKGGMMSMINNTSDHKTGWLKTEGQTSLIVSRPSITKFSAFYYTLCTVISYESKVSLFYEFLRSSA